MRVLVRNADFTPILEGTVDKFRFVENQVIITLANEGKLPLTNPALPETKEEVKVEFVPDVPEVLPHDDLFIKEVVKFLEEQMDNPELSVEDMADHLHLGRKVFSRRLKSIVGVTPTAFMQEIRLKHAAQLLLTQNYSVSQVAYMTGFNDPRYFNRCFKKHFEMTPSEYVNKEKLLSLREL